MKKRDFNLTGFDRDTYGEGNRAYQLRKGHCDVYTKGDTQLYFSYETLVAFKVAGYHLVCIQNYWGPTTGKHLNWIENYKDHRYDCDAFEMLAKQYLEPLEVLDTRDPIKTVGAISAMFSLMSKDKADTVDQRARFYKTIDGISFPPDWHDLPAEEKIKRIDALDAFALEGK